MRATGRRSGRVRSGLALRPFPEGMEPRDLLSIIPTLATGGPARPPVADLARSVAMAQAGGVGNQGISGSTPPIIPNLTGAQPTPRELARERFRAVFSGPVYAGGPRFTDQSKIFYFRGLGGSTQFLHGDFQMALIFPGDPALPIVGGAYMQDKNINSAGALGLDLVADPASLDRRGRPTRLSFSNDANIYSGVDYFFQAGGTVTIRYAKDSATVVFSGLLYTNGITNPLKNQDLQARGGRLFPRSK